MSADTATASPTRGKVSTEAVLLTELVLDPALQCRAAMDAAVIDDYADKMKEGTRFPPIDVYRVEDGQLLVVDGWHRHAAAVKAGAKRIECTITDSSRRVALLMAVQANANHGLHRTQADKRKAVQVLLMDPEWCKLSSRDMARAAGVSHVFVQQLRKTYGVDKGKVLEPKRREEVDGDLPAVWKKLLTESPTWEHREIEAFRIAPGPMELAAIASLDGVSNSRKEALLLRREELASGDWPWPEDTDDEARAARAARLDTAEDIARALGARDCPQQSALYQVLSDIRRLDKAADALPAIEKRFAGRPRLLEALAVRRTAYQAERAAAEAASPWPKVYAITELTDPEAQAAAWNAAHASTRKLLQENFLHKLHPFVRDGVYRATMAPDAAACPRPGCGGWMHPARWHGGADSCVRCNGTVKGIAEQLTRALATAGEVLTFPGYGVRVAGVVLDVDTLDLLGSLQAVLQEGKAQSWVSSAPTELARRLRVWAARGAPETMLVEVADTDTDTDGSAE